jgi:hypothetical protein
MAIKYYLAVFGVVISVLAPRAHAQECVVLLHGLARTHYAMWWLERRLKQDHYWVVNQGYDSREKPIAELTPVVASSITACQQRHATPIHFVTHSLGGILVRSYFQQNKPTEDIGKVVMLAPPNHGSEIVDRYRQKFWFKWFGPAAQQLGTHADSLPNRLLPIALPVGVIAGDYATNPLFKDLFPGANDGTVSVASTRLNNMQDFIVVDRGHTFIMNSAMVYQQILAFLRTGSFVHVQ